MRRAKPGEPPPIAIANFADGVARHRRQDWQNRVLRRRLVRRRQGCDRNRRCMCVDETADNCSYGDARLPKPGPQGRGENQHDGHHRRETEGRPDAESASGLRVGGPFYRDCAQSEGETIERRDACARPQCRRHKDKGWAGDGQEQQR